MPCNICAGEKAGFQKGKEIPFWQGRTCNAGELLWACKRPNADKGKKFLKQFCCDDGPYPDWAKEGLKKKEELPKDFAKCLCEDGKFLMKKEIPYWKGRTCVPGELEWACKRPDSDGGKRHLKASCCEPPEEDKFGDEEEKDEEDEERGRERRRTPDEDEEDGEMDDGPPPCASTCPRDAELTCALLKTYLDGCASSCPDTMKQRYLKEMCHSPEEKGSADDEPTPGEEEPMSGGEEEPMSGDDMPISGTSFFQEPY